MLLVWSHSKKGRVQFCNSVSPGFFLKMFNAGLPSTVLPVSETQTVLFPLIFIFHSTFTKQPLLTVEYDLGLLLRESHGPVGKVGKCY